MTDDKDIEKMKEELNQIIDIGNQVYEEHRRELEKLHYGKLVAIDSEKREIVSIGSNRLDTVEEAQRKNGKKTYYTRWVGKNKDFVYSAS